MDTENFKIIYTCGWGEIDDFETHLKGHRNDVVIILKDGTQFKVDFISADRVNMELNLIEQSGELPIYAEPGLIILKEVTKRLIEQSIEKIFLDGYFKFITPMQTH